MDDIIALFTLSFMIGLTGALAPGPMLVATISASLKQGWRSGPRVVLGHMVLELAVFVLIIFGLSTLAVRYSGIVAGIGGIALIAFGLLTISGSRKASIDIPESEEVTDPVVAGVLTSAANPYFWIWWLTIGSAFILDGLRGGLIAGGIFMIGHWMADMGFYTVVAASADRGKVLIADSHYKWILAGCGVFLILFGIYYVISAAL